MGDPISWLMAGATALQAGGTIMETQAERGQIDAEGKIAGYNAAASAQQGSQAEEAQRRQARQFLARQRVAIGEAGIEDSGTVRKVQEQSAVEAELDALNIRYGSTLQTQGFQAEQNMTKARGKAVTRSGYMKAAGQLLGGGAQTQASRKQYGKT